MRLPADARLGYDELAFILPPLPTFLARIPRALLGRSPPNLLLRMLLTGGDHGLAEGIRNALRQVRSEVVAGRISAALSVDVSVELERYSRPLLYLRARQDRIIPARAAQCISALEPATELVELDGPHLILQASPEAAWRHIEPFLGRAAARRAG